MIDINLIRENPTLVKENMKKKFQDEKVGLVDEAYKLGDSFEVGETNILKKLVL